MNDSILGPDRIDPAKLSVSDYKKQKKLATELYEIFQWNHNIENEFNPYAREVTYNE